MNKSIFKTKKFWIILIVVALVALIGYGRYKKATTPPQYDTVKVARGNLVQTVEATGKIQSSNDLSLRFEAAGTLGEVKVKEGDTVKAGAVLMSLRAADLNAAVAQAQASLNQRIAGANVNERAYYQAAADSAKADWERTKSDAVNTIITAQAALDTAKNNLKLAEGGESSLIVTQSYDDTVALLQATLSKLDDGLTQADNILGIDNTLANYDFKDYLSLLDTGKISAAKAAYQTAREARNQSRNLISPLNTGSTHGAIDLALPAAKDALAKMNILLTDVAQVLEATSPVGTISQTSLDAKKTIIGTTRAGITTQYTSMINQEQAIFDAKNSYNTYQVAYNKATNDLSAAQTTAASMVAIKEAAYNQALANLQNKIEPTREVDLAPLRAALSQAVANRDKAILRAPVDGVVAKVNKKVGESVSPTEVAVEFISPHFEIDVDIPETDVSKLKLNDTVSITLDAFGDDVKFSGKVVSIDPASTNIQDVVYYKVKVSLDDTDKAIKPGMTANVTIATDHRENVLYIVSRAVRTNSEKYVRVLVDAKTGTTKDVPVVIGLKADDDKVEIVSGLQEGDSVLIGTK